MLQQLSFPLITKQIQLSRLDLAFETRSILLLFNVMPMLFRQTDLRFENNPR